ncbi:MAG: hypothetical protein KGL39_33900 [Patescibacteria group bacterium]|nr:hypothetical protein [Patescibacteria group bacterium]
MTVKLHFFKKPNVDMQPWPLDPSFATTINAESFVWFNQSVNYMQPLSADANAANFLGLCVDQSPLNLIGSTFTGGGNFNANTNNMGLVARYGQAAMFVTSGQSYVPGQALYIGADAQTVTNIAGSNQIAYVSGEQAAITNAASGSKVLVDFRANWPNLAIR